jgi:hypothetical protein
VWPHQTGAVKEEVGDYIDSLDLSQGSVMENARSVVESLLRKDLQNIASPLPLSSAARSHDPRITMEMRHKKVGGFEVLEWLHCLLSPWLWQPSWNLRPHNRLNAFRTPSWLPLPWQR